jgi:energy-coupling factor transporter ATP-binding protein EcfA2
MSLEHDRHTITPIGITDWRNTNQKFGIHDADRLRHIYCVGRTGSGKSTLLQNMAIADLQSKGTCVIDPHGQLAESLLHFVPKERIEQTIYFNVADTLCPISYNPLANVAAEDRHFVVTGLLNTFKKIWLLSWGNRLEHILRFTLLALLEYPGATLLDVTRMLTNESFRVSVLHGVRDSYVLAYWFNEFAKYPAAFRQEAISPILNKFGIFSANVTLRNILSQKQSNLRLNEVFENGGILICNLSKGSIGEEASSILGSIIINGLQLAALRRTIDPWEQVQGYFLYCDEVHLYANDVFLSLLSEMRKFGLSVFLTHQYLDQMPEAIRAAIFGNVGTLIAFGVGNDDAEVLAKEFTPVFKAKDLLLLPRYRMYLKLMIHGATSKPFSAISLPLPEKPISWQREIIAYTRKTYSGSIEEICRHPVELSNEKVTVQGQLF